MSARAGVAPVSVRRLRLRRAGNALGAEVAGVDLAAPLSDEAAVAIRAALAEHHVLFFRDQRLDPACLTAASARLGPLLRVPYVEPLAEHPDVIAVLKEADEERISVFGGEWHSDFSFLASPPAATMLHAVEVPETGGDTLFASGCAAYEALSPGLRRLLDAARAMHSGHVYGRRRAPTGAATSRSIGISRGNPEADEERAHPVVVAHPATGRRALFVNPIYTTRFEDATAAESAPLLAWLYAHATRPEFTLRFRWTPGAVALWDNRMTMHLAVNDYDGRRRLLYRTTIASL